VEVQEADVNSYSWKLKELLFRYGWSPQAESKYSG
jgi:hypothetical protein